MAQITSYATLTDAFTNWRADAGLLSARYDEAIQLTQEAINNGDELLGIQPLRVRQMQTSSALSVTGGTASIPSDYLVWRHVEWLGRTPTVILEYVERQDLNSNWIALDSGDPKIFTIQGSGILIRPIVPSSGTDTTNYFLFYYQTIPDLIANSTNWLCTANPSVYLWGGLYYLAVIADEEERAAVWLQRFKAKLQGIQVADGSQRGAPSHYVREDEYF